MVMRENVAANVTIEQLDDTPPDLKEPRRAAQLQNLATDTVLEYIEGSDHPDLQVYRRDVQPELLHLWTWKIQHVCELGGFYGKNILEAGSGFGWDAVGLSILGKNHVTAMDILPSMVDGMTQCLDAMAAKGSQLDVTPLQGDICNVDLPKGSFDGIVSFEAVEHVHNLEHMFAHCYELLKPGARLVIVNDSNRWNTAFRDATFEMWKERDGSWDHAKWLAAEVRPVEHANAKPYAAMREEIINEAAPSLDEASRNKLVAATAGMIRPEIISATETYLKHRTLPTRPEFSWCRNPETGEYAERLLDPFEMVDMLRAAGFKARLRHIFRKPPFNLANGISFKPINKKLFDKRAQFALVAEKPR